MDTVGLGVLGVAADVPDVRIRERHDLLAVRRIRQDFLISGHRRIENDFTHGLTVTADGNTLENGTIGEGEQSRFEVGHKRSEEHTSELQSLMRISYAVLCLKKKTTI